ncbi:crossover junction endodeoxyribonuclease [Aspergillus undulatus]|uniref:crossover junction endodeoxyribonuclease n=1 Tax=Aspergillus undulatus TaxID=1810928 RepID=UPI003CCE028B
MGIPGLINALGPGERISLSKLAITHLERTSRPMRIAVDISIWLFQVQAGRGGKNPELRTLFFRLLKLLALPIHPLFVYDGKHKPPFKRGKVVSARSYGSAPIIRLSKILIDLFKFPRHEAPGEAEAECSRLQMAGVVDAVMSNDVDALMFGSKFTVMNFSKEAGSSASGATHVTSYKTGNDAGSNVKLARSEMILFAMLSGGDYLPSGVPKCGHKLAAEIAKAGFGGDLLDLIEADGAELDARLNEWRERLQYELEENESGYFQTKHKAVRIPETFPDRTILSYYAKPIVSSDQEIESLNHRLRDAWDRDIDVWQIRQFTADAFEWNYRSGARKVIRLLAEPLISYKLRLGQHPLPSGRSRISKSDVPVFEKVYKSRASFNTDGLTELQFDVVPIDIVGLDLMAEEPNPPLPSQGTASVDEEEEDGEAEAEVVPQSPTKKRVTKRYDPYSSEKVWIFETLALRGVPHAVERWKQEQLAKQSAASAPKKTTSRKAGPRRRKELDPSMKQGSILKYGTLKKGRSDMSEYKSVQLFDAAVSTTSPTKSPPSSSPGTYGLTMSTPPKLGQRMDGFDYLVDQFASCDLSGSPVKCRPATRSLRSRRVAVNSNGAEVVDLADEDGSPPAAPKIHMSYSTASYRGTHCHNYFSRPCSPSPQAQPKEKELLLGVEHLEHAISSLKLETLNVKATKRSSKKTSAAKPKTPKEPETRGPETAIEIVTFNPQHLDVLGKPKTRSRKTAKEDTQTKTSCHETASTDKAPSHIEAITVRDGFWTAEVDPQDENEQPADKKTKKRIARVSILDLTRE